MVSLNNTNGGFGGVTTDFFTLDLSGGEVVRRYWTALQGGYLIPNRKHQGGAGEKNYYALLECGGNVFESIDFAVSDVGYMAGAETSMLYSIKNNQIIRFGGTAVYMPLYRPIINPASVEYNNDWLHWYQTEDFITINSSATMGYKGANISVAFHNLFQDIGINHYYYTDNGGQEEGIEFKIRDNLIGYHYGSDAGTGASRINKGRANIEIYRELANINCVYFVDNIENLSEDKILQKIRLSNKMSEIRALSSRLDERNGINKARKNIVVLIKQDDRLKIIFYALGLCGSDTKQKELNYPWRAQNKFIFFTGMDLWGVADINPSHNDTGWEIDDENKWHKISSPFSYIVTPKADNMRPMEDRYNMYAYVLGGFFFDVYEYAPGYRIADILRLGRTYHHYNKNEDTPWHVGGVNYYPNTFPLRQKAIEYRQYLRDERGFTREQMGHD